MRTRWLKFATHGLLPFVAAIWLVMLVPYVAAATASELLEKAIYTEETVGNVDEAMKLYEQVIADGKSAEQAAAQAQYRLALCHLKKNQESQATAAFESLIKNYPNEAELVAKAQEHLPSKLELAAAPWKSGERLQLNMKLPTGLDIGTMFYMVDAEKHEGKDVWRCSSRGIVTANDAISYSEVLCDKESFAPISSVWKHSMLGEAEATYKDNKAVIKVSNKDEPFTIAYTPPAFDNEQAAELFRRLPLEVGYKTTLTIITSLGGSKIDLPVSVVETETVKVQAGTFECFKIELGVVNQTFWISADEHRYIVKFAAGGVTAELVKVAQAETGKAEKLSGENFSLTLPAGWLSYMPGDGGKKEKREGIYLLDPKADARTELNVRPKESLKEDQTSTKSWTESYLAKMKSVYGDIQIRDPGLSDRKVGGLSATEVMADFTKDGKSMTIVGVAVIGSTAAATVQLVADADKVEKLRPDFDKIVDSLQLK